MSLSKRYTLGAIEKYPNETPLVCDDWFINNPDGWPYNPIKPRTIGELRTLYNDVPENDRIIVTDIHCDTCKKADFVFKDGTVIMELY